MNFNTIKPGDIAQMSTHKDRVFACEFVGFSDIDVVYGEGGKRFDTLKEAKQHFNVRTNAELEHVGEHLGYGHGVYAIFKFEEDADEGYWKDKTWGAYLFNGVWCCGSGADRITFCN